MWCQASAKTKWKILDGCEKKILTTLEDGDDLPVVNYGRTGYYRVDYEEPLKSRLLDNIANRDSVVGSDDLTGMLSDAYGLDLIETRNISDFLDLALSLGKLCTRVAQLKQIYICSYLHCRQKKKTSLAAGW